MIRWIAGWLLLVLAAPLWAQGVKEIVAKFPAKTAQEEAALVEKIVSSGPEAVKEVCAMVQPPGSTDDTAARFAVTGLMRSVKHRGVVAKGIAGSIDGADDPDVKAFFIARLQEMGGDESVPAVAKYLGDEKLCAPACAALERIGTQPAVQALVKALPTSRGPCRIQLIKSLGVLKARAADGEIAKLVRSDDVTVKETAIWALVNMGSELAVEPVNTYLKEAPAAQKPKALAWMLLGARRQAEAGKGREAAVTCKAVMNIAGMGGSEFDHAAGAALQLLADVAGESALDELARAAKSEQVQIRAAALDAAAGLKGESVTRRLMAELSAAGEESPAARIDLLAFLGSRGDQTALPAVLESLRSEDAAVRLAAARAAARLNPNTAVAPLVEVVVKRPVTAKPVADILARMPGNRSLDALAAATAAAPTEAQVIILEVLASRMDKANKPTVLRLSGSDAAAVRIAALRAMERVGGADDVPRLVDLALAAKGEPEEQAALRAAIAAGAEVTDAAQRAKPLLAAMARSQGAKRGAVSRALARIGGPGALRAVVADLNGEDRNLREGAIRALAEWTEASALGPLLEIARSDQTPLPQQVIALRGVVNVTKESQLSPQEKVAAYAKALVAARRPDEKRLVVAALATERTVESLDVAAPLLDDESLKGEAALAVVKIVAPTERRQRGLSGEKAIAALKKAIPLCPDAAAKADAERYLTRVESRRPAEPTKAPAPQPAKEPTKPGA